MADSNIKVIISVEDHVTKPLIHLRWRLLIWSLPWLVTA